MDCFLCSLVQNSKHKYDKSQKWKSPQIREKTFIRSNFCANRSCFINLFRYVNRTIFPFSVRFAFSGFLCSCIPRPQCSLFFQAQIELAVGQSGVSTANFREVYGDATGLIHIQPGHKIFISFSQYTVRTSSLLHSYGCWV